MIDFKLKAINDRVLMSLGNNFVDIYALLACIVSLGGGIYLTLINCSPDWLTRTGSLIIIIGLIAATFRINKYFENHFKKIMERVELVSVGNLQDIIVKLLKQEGMTLSDNDILNSASYKKAHSTVLPIIKKNRRKALKDIIEKYNNRLLRYEIYLVIFGTFINGFGEYFFYKFKIC